MKTFKNICAQGDVYIMRVNMKVPEGAVEVTGKSPQVSFASITQDL